MRTTTRILAAALVAAAGVAYVSWPRTATEAAPLPLGRTTSAADMSLTANRARARLDADPGDTEAAVALADVLIRRTRVESDGGLAVEAEAVLRSALREAPDDYGALRMVGAACLARHKFRDAIEAANKAIAARRGDAWNYGVLGDAHLELGDYEKAFQAFDQMARLRPDAASYARVAYAHELQGRLDEALRHMRRAAEATSAHDPESLAWHFAQLGHLYLELGRFDEAGREYGRADFTFPGHPYAHTGLARVAVARGDYATALSIYRSQLDEAPTPENAAAVGDLLRLTGDETGAHAMYARAEALEREGWRSEEPQPAALARMLADRGLKADEAVALAERAAAVRTDIFTLDALAVAYLRAGRLDEAAAASRRSLRTGSGDRRLLYHAAAIAHARGERMAARRWLDRALERGGAVDLAIVGGAASLSKQLSF